MGIVTTWCITVIEAIIASRLIYPMPGKTIAKQHETFCGRTLLGRARSKEYLRKREEEGTKILSRREREREKRIELAKTNSVDAGARGKLAVWSREK